MSETGRDARTTPPWARPFVLAALFVVASWFLLCFYYLVRDEPQKWTTFGAWDMFTDPKRRHGALEAEALVDGRWQPVDLEALFPTRWESGPRYARPSFRESKRRLRTLADSACDRHPDAPTRIRLVDVRWPVTVGQVEQPRKKVEKKLKLDWDCSETAPRPGGVVW